MITGRQNCSNDEAARLAAEANAAAEQLRLEERDRRAEEDAWSNLAGRGRRVQEEILREKVGDINVYKTSHQNMITAHTLCETLEPLLAKHAVATPVVAKIKVMVTAAAVQQQQKDLPVPLVSRAASSRPPSDQGRAARKQARSDITQNSTGPMRDAHDYFNMWHREREEAA